MMSPAHAADARAVEGPSDDETAGLLPAESPATAAQASRTRQVVVALGLLVCTAAAAATLHPSAGCEASAVGQNADVGSELGLAERRRLADDRAHAIVEVMNEKPQAVIGGLVKKAMQKAGENTLAKRRQMGDQSSFNEVLADITDQCTLQRPEVESGDGIYLANNYEDDIYLAALESAPTQWKITHAGGPPDVYYIEAIVPGTGGSYLDHHGGKVSLGKGGNDLKWRISPVTSDKNNEGLFTVEAIGSLLGRAYLGQKGATQVALSHSVGSSEVWRIPCVAGEYQRQAQRKANCAFNILYATQYVARASLTIEAAARTCPNSKGLLSKVCAINSLVIVSSFSNLALAISDAASTCAETTNVKALCAGGVMALIVALSDIGAGGLITATACQPGLTTRDLGLPEGFTPANIGGPSFLHAGESPSPVDLASGPSSLHSTASPSPVDLGSGLSSLHSTTSPSPVDLGSSLKNSLLGGGKPSGRRLFLGGGTNNFLGQCILDFTQVAWSLGSVGIAITAAVRDSCPSSIQGTGILVGISQSACSMDIAAVIYAFSRIAMFLAMAMIHCTDELNLQALCAGGVSALIAAAAALVVSGDAFYTACNQGIGIENNGGTVPLRIGAAVEAGETRRLAAEALAAGAERTDVHKLATDLGYNISTPLKLPTFDNVDSALKVLEEFDSRRAEDFGVGEASLRSRFKSVEEMWKHIGVDLSDPAAIPAAPAPRDESERFVKLMEPVLSAKDKARVAEAMAPGLSQKWQRLTSSRKCL